MSAESCSLECPARHITRESVCISLTSPSLLHNIPHQPRIAYCCLVFTYSVPLRKAPPTRFSRVSFYSFLRQGWNCSGLVLLLPSALVLSFHSIGLGSDVFRTQNLLPCRHTSEFHAFRQHRPRSIFPTAYFLLLWNSSVQLLAFLHCMRPQA